MSTYTITSEDYSLDTTTSVAFSSRHMWHRKKKAERKQSNLLSSYSTYYTPIVSFLNEILQSYTVDIHHSNSELINSTPIPHKKKARVIAKPRYSEIDELKKETSLGNTNNQYESLDSDDFEFLKANSGKTISNIEKWL